MCICNAFAEDLGFVVAHSGPSTHPSAHVSYTLQGHLEPGAYPRKHTAQGRGHLRWHMPKVQTVLRKVFSKTKSFYSSLKDLSTDVSVTFTGGCSGSSQVESKHQTLFTSPPCKTPLAVSLHLQRVHGRVCKPHGAHVAFLLH